MDPKTILYDERMFGLYGVVVGFGLSELAKWIGESRKDRDAVKSCRELLKIELARNAELLRRLWTEINESPVDTGHEEIVKCRLFIDKPYPAFSTRALESVFPMLTKALSVSEVRTVFDQYSRYEVISHIDDRLRALAREQSDAWNIASGGREFASMSPGFGSMPLRMFDRNAPRYWAELKVTVEQVLQSEELK